MPSRYETTKEEYIEKMMQILQRSTTFAEFDAEAKELVSPIKKYMIKIIFDKYISPKAAGMYDLTEYEPSTDYQIRMHTFTIYVAGLEPQQNEIMALYNEFSAYGEIVAIYCQVNQRFALIRFSTAESCFSAVTSKKFIFDNEYIKVGYATNLETLLKKSCRDETEQKLIRSEKIIKYAKHLEKEFE